MTNANDAIKLLQRLIATPSFSREEDAVADIWYEWLDNQPFIQKSHDLIRLHNNVFLLPKCKRADRPLMMLNSHIDTVKPAASYTRDPFAPDIIDGKLYGLGSNDAGASGVSLATAFLNLGQCQNLPADLMLALTAEEEVMGQRGMRATLPYLAERGMTPDMAIIGEPTGMQPAIAERGLLVLDCTAKGKSGHAARGEGINALYRAMEDIQVLRQFTPERISDTLGPISVNVTMINCGTQHNVVPDVCTFVADVRTTDAYTNEETVELLRQCVKWSELQPRSTRVRASVISNDHPLVKAAEYLGKTPFVSPTSSDMALMPDFPTLKIGPGQSSRSHAADEYIKISEIEEAISTYQDIITHSSSLIPH